MPHNATQCHTTPRNATFEYRTCLETGETTKPLFKNNFLLAILSFFLFLDTFEYRQCLETWKLQNCQDWSKVSSPHDLTPLLYTSPWSEGKDEGKSGQSHGGEGMGTKIMFCFVWIFVDGCFHLLCLFLSVHICFSSESIAKLSLQLPLHYAALPM